MKVSAYMTDSPTTIRSGTDYREAVELMHERNLHHIPVIGTDDKIVGIVTQRDLHIAARHFQEADVPVSQVMHTPVVTITADEPLASAARQMIASRIGGLPVLDDERVVGVVTETDLFRALIDVLEEQ